MSLFLNVKDYLINFIKIAIGIGLLAFLYTRLDDPQRLWQQMLSANWLLLALALIVQAAAVALSALKWRVLLRAQQVDVPISRLLSYQWMAIFFDNFLPAQVGGDVLRGYSLARDTHRRAAAAASVLIDRFTGLTAFMLAAAFSSSALLIWGGIPTPASQQELAFLRFIDLRLIAVGSTAVSLALLTALSMMLSRRLKRWAERIIVRLPLREKVLPVWQKMAEAINAYRHSYRAIAIAGAGSILIVIITSLTIWLLTEAVAPGQISFLQVLVINPIIAFLGILPLSPGGLGVRQVAFVALFITVGVDSHLGLLVGVLQQLTTYIVSIPGLWIWVRGQKQPVAEPAALSPDVRAR